MGLSSQDFVTAFRALSTRSCAPSAIRKALRLQASLVVKGRRLTLSESLVEARAVSPFTAGELSSAAPVDPRSDPDAVSAAGEIFLTTESASEVELDRIVDALMRPPDPRTLKEVPVPPSLAGYDVSWEVGRSPAGSVYRGSKRGTGATVAIKVYRREAFASDAARRAFLDGLGAHREWAGPDVIKILEVLDLDGHAIVVEEFVEGSPLDKLLAERKISLRRGFEIVGRAAEQLAPLHARGTAHGRLSARSIFVQANDRPKLEGSDHPAERKPADDIDALGAVLYEIAAGTPPYGGFRSHELKAPSRHNSACAGPAEKIVLKALARDPARRYPDAAALSEDIGRYLRHEEVLADVDLSEAAPPSRTGLAAGSGRWKWKLAAVAAALLIAVTLVALLRNSGADRGAAQAPPPVIPAPTVLAPPAPTAPAPPPRVRTDPRARQLAAKGPVTSNEDLDFQFKASGLLATRSFDELDRLAEEVLIRGPEAGWAHYYRALVALQQGDDDAALKHADRALALEWNRANLYELRFDVRMVRAEYRAALEELSRLYPKETVSPANQEIQRLTADLERDPTYAEALVRRGALYLYRRVPNRAAEDFARAVSAGESRAEYFLALALKELDRTGESKDAARRFLAAHGEIPGAREARAFLESLP